MRSTIHVVSPRDYWGFASGIGPSRREWWLRTWGRHEPAANLAFVERELETALAGRTWHRSEIDALLPTRSRTVWSGTWVPLVRVPPSGTWERRRADLFRLAAEWIEPVDTTEDEGLEHVLRRYLAAFGPASLGDAADWAGVTRARLEPVAERLPLRTSEDAIGKRLLDLPRQPLPAEEIPAPPRFLGTWDAILLAHARRTEILPERFRSLVFSTKRPQSVATFLVDGAVAGAWWVERAASKAMLRLEPFEPLPRDARRELRDEGERLVRFHEPDAASYAVR
jgi:DNA glycosylase AlkZ-like